MPIEYGDEPGPASADRAPRVRDDLLSGFTRPGQQLEELRGFFATTLAAALLGWDLAFNFGAYHVVFYSRLMQIFVLSTVLLFGALALRRSVTVRPLMYAVLSIPAWWVAWRLAIPAGGIWRDAYSVIDGIFIGLIVITLPVTLWAVARIVAPEYFALSTLRLRLLSVAIVAVIALVGFLAGRFNNHLFTCNEFYVAGDTLPGNCRTVPPAHGG